MIPKPSRFKTGSNSVDYSGDQYKALLHDVFLNINTSVTWSDVKYKMSAEPLLPSLIIHL